MNEHSVINKSGSKKGIFRLLKYVVGRYNDYNSIILIDNFVFCQNILSIYRIYKN